MSGKSPNAKKKSTDDTPVVEAVKKCKTEAEWVPLADFIRVSNLAVSTFKRQSSRLNHGLIPVQKRGRKKVELNIDEFIPQLLVEITNSKRYCRRFRRQKNRNSNFDSLPEWQKRQIIEAAKKQFNADLQWDLFEVKFCEPHLVWGMDIAEYEFDGYIFNVLQVMDIGSRHKFEPLFKIGTFNAAEVAPHLEMLMAQHGIPLFLKRDNGGNLNADPVEQILQMFAVLPLNSPPGCPQYNGVVEKAQGDLKRKTIKLLSPDPLLNMAKGHLMYAINHDNTTPKPILGDHSPFEIWNRPHRKIDKFERENIAKSITMRAMRILNGNGLPLTKELISSAWRRAARYFMQESGIIEFYRHGKKVDYLLDA